MLLLLSALLTSSFSLLLMSTARPLRPGVARHDALCALSRSKEDPETVAAYMSAAFHLSPDMNLHEAMSLLSDKGITGAPVVELPVGRLVGVVSQFDLLREFARKFAKSKDDQVEDSFHRGGGRVRVGRAPCAHACAGRRHGRSKSVQVS